MIAQLSHGMRYDFSSGKIDGMLTIEALAWSLAGINRYNAWTNVYWSVASHACLVAEIIAAMGAYGPEVALDGLHHDDHESLTGDQVRPFLDSLSESAQAELRVAKRRAQRAIERALGLQGNPAAAGVVQAADLAALECERRILFGYRITWPTESMVNPKMLSYGEKILAGDFANITGGSPAAQRFVSHHNALMARIK